MGYKAIFFDWDGVITDSVDIKTKAYAELYRDYGIETQRKVTEYHLTRGGVSRFEKIRYFHKNYLGVDIGDSELNAWAARFSDIVFDAVVEARFMPGAVETISAESGKGTLLFVASGTPTDEIIRIAEAKRLSRYFTEIIGSPESKTGIVKRLLIKYALPAGDCLMIGDAPEDYDAATANGVKFLGIVPRPGGFRAAFPPGTTILSEVSII